MLLSAFGLPPIATKAAAAGVKAVNALATRLTEGDEYGDARLGDIARGFDAADEREQAGFGTPR